MNTEQRIEVLRQWIRDPRYSISKASPMGLHRQYLEDIWSEALRLSGGDISEALTVATNAVRSSLSEDEPRDAYQARLNGLPSKVFGVSGGFEGVDKLQHFFASALTAYHAGTKAAAAAGILVELGEWFASFFKDTGAEGDIWVNNLGAAFGAALRMNPYQSIDHFLRTAPGADEAIVLRLGTPYFEGAYIIEMIVPSPEGLKNGELIELRCVDAEGYAYAMGVMVDGEVVQYRRLDGSSYRLTFDDPWYIPPEPTDDQEDLRQQGFAVPTEQELEIGRRIQRGEQARRRLQDDLDQLQLQHEVLNERMRQQQWSQWHQQMATHDQEVLRHHNETQQQLRNTNRALDALRQTQSEIQQHHLLELGRSRDQTNNSIAEQSRAQQILRTHEIQQEHIREEQRHQIREEQRRQRESMEGNHRRQLDELNRQHLHHSIQHPVHSPPPTPAGPGSQNV